MLMMIMLMCLVTKCVQSRLGVRAVLLSINHDDDDDVEMLTMPVMTMMTMTMMMMCLV